MADVLKWPRDWPSSASYEQEFATALTEALNRMSAEGWEYVGSYVFHQHPGPGYAVFRRDVPPEPADPHGPR